MNDSFLYARTKFLKFKFPFEIRVEFAAQLSCISGQTIWSNVNGHCAFLYLSYKNTRSRIWKNFGMTRKHFSDHTRYFLQIIFTAHRKSNVDPEISVSCRVDYCTI